MLTLSFFFPAFSIPFLISKMQIIGKNHLLSRFCCCCHHQPQRCSQPCAPLTREGACRGPQTPSCVPSSLWVPGQLHQNHRTAASKSQDTQPWGWGGQKNPQQTQPCVDRTPKGLWLFYELCEELPRQRSITWGEPSAALPEIEDPLAGNVSVFRSLCIYYTSSTHLRL